VHASPSGRPAQFAASQVPIPFPGGPPLGPPPASPVLAARLLGRGEGSALSDLELLSVLIGNLRHPGTRERVEALLGAGSIRDLARSGPSSWWRRLPPRARARLAAAVELGRRLDLSEGHVPALVQGPADVFEITADLRRLRREHFIGLYLNTRNRLLIRETISIGSLNASIVHPREVFEPALRQGAASLIVVHNHPSGETEPSEDDLAITRRLSEAGEILGVPLLDHVIVGGQGYTSLKETRDL
jgi:DNA repair protein RadC